MDTFFDLSLEMMVIANEAGYFERVNATFVEAVGHLAEELLQKPILEFVHPADRAATEQQATKLFEGESMIDFENRYACADGSWKWLSWRARIDPVSRRIFAFARDVTAAKEAQLAAEKDRRSIIEMNANLQRRVRESTRDLEESEARFATLVDGVRDYALIMLDADGRVVSWNEGATRTKRFQAHEILGRHVGCLYMPEDAAAEKPARHLAEAAQTGRVEDEGWRMRGDGTRYRANVVITALREPDGQLQGFAKITRDITREYETNEELSRQQSLLRSLMDNLAEGVIACDAQDRITFFNKTAREWHPNPPGDITADEWSRAYHLYEADAVTPLPPERAPLRRAARGERVRDQELAVVAPGRAPRYVLAGGDPLLDENGEQMGAVVVLHDITERREAERQALRTQRMESIGMLAGGIAHDLNNALAPVLMSIEMLRMEFPEAGQWLDMLETSSRRGAAMVKQLLTFAKGTSGNEAAVNLRQLIKEIQGLGRSTFPKNIEIEVDCEESVPAVLGDPTQLHQVLLNLCVNARDAMPRGGVLTLRGEPVSFGRETVPSGTELVPGDYVHLAVSDTGEGIPPEIIDRILEPFFTTKAADKGTGLGLATVLGIVRSHQGAMRIESEVGRGTTMHLYFPTQRHFAAVEIDRPAEALGVEGRGRQVLLVEDEQSIREIGRNILSNLGFQVHTATDGAEALQLLQSVGQEIDLVITDKDMPALDGFALIREASPLVPDARWVLLSGHLVAEDQPAIDELGVVVLEKPFTQGDLVKVLREVLPVVD